MPANQLPPQITADPRLSPTESPRTPRDKVSNVTAAPTTPGRVRFHDEVHSSGSVGAVSESDASADDASGTHANNKSVYDRAVMVQGEQS